MASPGFGGTRWEDPPEESLPTSSADQSCAFCGSIEVQWPGTTPSDTDEEVRRPLAVFRRADRGARPLPR